MSIDSLTGTDLDEAVAHALGEVGTEHGYVSSDGGKSMSASTHDRDCWPSIYYLQQWLDEQHAKGYLKDSVVVRRIEYRRRHDDVGQRCNCCSTPAGTSKSPSGSPE